MHPGFFRRVLFSNILPTHTWVLILDLKQWLLHPSAGVWLVVDMCEPGRRVEAQQKGVYSKIPFPDHQAGMRTIPRLLTQYCPLTLKFQTLDVCSERSLRETL